MQLGLTNRCGFSTVELVTIIAIFTLLAIVGIPQYEEYVKKSRTAKAAMHLEEIRTAQVVYRKDPRLGNGNFAADIIDLGWTLPGGEIIGRAPASYQYSTNTTQSKALTDQVEEVANDSLTLSHVGAWE